MDWFGKRPNDWTLGIVSVATPTLRKINWVKSQFPLDSVTAIFIASLLALPLLLWVLLFIFHLLFTITILHLYSCHTFYLFFVFNFEWVSSHTQDIASFRSPLVFSYRYGKSFISITKTWIGDIKTLFGIFSLIYTYILVCCLSHKFPFSSITIFIST